MLSTKSLVGAGLALAMTLALGGPEAGPAQAAPPYHTTHGRTSAAGIMKAVKARAIKARRAKSRDASGSQAGAVTYEVTVYWQHSTTYGNAVGNYTTHDQITAYFDEAGNWVGFGADYNYTWDHHRAMEKDGWVAVDYSTNPPIN
jgi:hypothetical protein